MSFEGMSGFAFVNLVYFAVFKRSELLLPCFQVSSNMVMYFILKDPPCIYIRLKQISGDVILENRFVEKRCAFNKIYTSLSSSFGQVLTDVIQNKVPIYYIKNLRRVAAIFNPLP